MLKVKNEAKKLTASTQIFGNRIGTACITDSYGRIEIQNQDHAILSKSNY